MFIKYTLSIRSRNFCCLLALVFVRLLFLRRFFFFSFLLSRLFYGKARDRYNRHISRSFTLVVGTGGLRPSVLRFENCSSTVQTPLLESCSTTTHSSTQLREKIRLLRHCSTESAATVYSLLYSRISDDPNGFQRPSLPACLLTTTNSRRWDLLWWRQYNSRIGCCGRE